MAKKIPCDKLRGSISCDGYRIIPDETDDEKIELIACPYIAESKIYAINPESIVHSGSVLICPLMEKAFMERFYGNS